MATAKNTTYTITSPASALSLKLTYRGTTFYRVERTKGKLSNEQLKALGKIIPPTTNDFENYKKAFPQITYTAVTKEPSQFAAFNSAWFRFYEDFSGMPPKFGVADARALKSIMAHFKLVGGSEKEALAMWETFLAAWHKLDDFHKKNTDLKYISNKLNSLLNAVKNAIGAGTTTTGTNSSTSL